MRIGFTHTLAGAGIAAGLLLCATVQAQTAGAASSRVASVTLYPGSATVERVMRVPVGARQAEFVCLPAQLDEASLQLESDTGVAVGEISVRQVPRNHLGEACRSGQTDTFASLETQMARLQAEKQALELSSTYLTSQASARTEQSPAAQIAATATAIRQSQQAALIRLHQVNREIEALSSQLEPLQQERERSGVGQVSVVTVNLSAPQGGDVRLRYQVAGPGWQPSYRAYLDSDSQRVRLQRMALIAQSTGEDWSRVQITLSTGQPTRASTGPLPRPWRMGLEPPRVFEAPQAFAAPAPALDRITVTGARRTEFDVSQFDTRFASQFAIPQRVDVPSGGQRVAVSLGEENLTATLLHRSTPALDASAYVIASIPTPAGIWPRGTVSLYRDGAYAGRSTLNVDTLAEQGLAFGRDERVLVRVEQPQRNEGSTGIIARRQQREISRAFTVENRHRQAINLQVLDAAPVASHSDVRIQSSFSPQPQTESWSGQRGTVMWQQTLGAGETARFSAEHIVQWPQDVQLQEQR